MNFEFPPQENSQNKKEEKKKSSLGSLQKAILLTFGLMSGSMGSHAATESGKEEKKVSTEQQAGKDSLETHGLSLYTQSQTVEGATTPTGYNNSFFENQDNLSLEDIIAFAEKEGLPTDSNIHFQEALEKKYPDVVKEVMERYGTTNAVVFVDGKLGVRVREVIHRIQSKSEKPPTPVIEKKVDPYERWGGDRESIYDGNTLVAQLWAPTAKTHDAKDAGTLNTQKGMYLLRFVGKDGQFVNLDLMVDASVFQNQFTAGTKHFVSHEKYLEALEKADDSIFKGKTTAEYYDAFAEN